MEIIEPLILIVIVFIVGYILGQHHAIDMITDKIIEDPEGFIRLVKNAKNQNQETLELRRDKGVIYCFGKRHGFLAQAENFETLAEQIRRQLPDSEFVIPGDQKDFTQDELYEIAKCLVIKEN
jgi:hypothetical protein